MFLGCAADVRRSSSDLAKAKAEVAASGISNPTMNLEFPSDITSNGLSFGVLAQKVQSDLARPRASRSTSPARPVATSLNTYRAGTEQLGLWYWGPDYPDPNDYLVFLPGQTVGLRAGWPAGCEPGARERSATKAGVDGRPGGAQAALPADQQRT